jgi:hypothetical protein
MAEHMQKNILKPILFDGSESSWPSFKYRFETRLNAYQLFHTIESMELPPVGGHVWQRVCPT